MTTNAEELRKQAQMASAEEEGEGLLPPTTTFDISYKIKEGPRRGQYYKGRFEFTVPNAGKQIEIARMKALYLPQGANADPNGAFLVEMICYLSCCLTAKPSWWLPDSFYDTGVIGEVYKKASTYEARFLGKSTFVQDDAEGVLSSPQNEGSAGPDGSRAVDEVVPTSRKRREVLTPHHE